MTTQYLRAKLEFKTFSYRGYTFETRKISDNGSYFSAIYDGNRFIKYTPNFKTEMGAITFTQKIIDEWNKY